MLRDLLQVALEELFVSPKACRSNSCSIFGQREYGQTWSGPDIRGLDFLVNNVPMNNPHFANRDEYRANARVANMSEQQFEEHMNELFMRDNKKPLKQNVL